MKTNNDNALLYDDNCPLCAAYTKAFIKTGLLAKENRIAFTTIHLHSFPVDITRSRHEIPLINLKTGEVKYGIDALAEILNRKMSFIKPILGISWMYWFFKKLYSFISYNRKVIVAKPITKKPCFDCSPDFSFKHRIVLTLFTYSLSAVLFYKAGDYYFSALHFAWFFLCILVPLLLIFNKTKQQAADIMVHSGITGLLSIIIFAFSIKIFSLLFTSINVFIIPAYALALLIFMHQLIRRIRFYKIEYKG